MEDSRKRIIFVVKNAWMNSMPTNYKERLKISVEGQPNIEFSTKPAEVGLDWLTGRPESVIVAKGYTRIVIGERGPYVEFSEQQIRIENLVVPEGELKRVQDLKGVYYYDEWRSKDEANVKIYFQKKEVNYADYKVGMYYISPFDLLADGKVIIEKLDRKKKSNIGRGKK